jgi:hypothetical protein
MRAIKRWEDPKWSKCSGVPSRMMVNPSIVRPYCASLEGVKVRSCRIATRCEMVPGTLFSPKRGATLY